MPHIITTRPKLDIADARVSIIPTEGLGDEIPPKLRALTATIILLHKVNGDSGWLADLVAEIG